MSYHLVIDQGTHASRAILFDHQGQLLNQAEHSVGLERLDEYKVEQDAEEILHSVESVLDQLPQHRLASTESCALTTQRSTIVAWDKISGDVLAPAISWQDRRSQWDLDRFSRYREQIRAITGLPLSAHYSAGKIRWLLQHHPQLLQAADEHRLCLGPLASYLMYHLLRQSSFCIDHCNAQRSLLFDIHQLDWSDRLLQLFEIPKQVLPTCTPVCHDYGLLKHYDIPVKCVTGDQNAALFAHGQLATGTARINLGTGAFVLCAREKPVEDTPLLNSLAMTDAEQQQYLLEGTVNGAGAALSWAQESWPVDDLFEQLPAWLEQEQQPAIFINTVGGLGSPWWSGNSRPCFLNDEEYTLSQRYVGIIESILFLLMDNLNLMRELQAIDNLEVSGGLSKLDGLCQKLSNLSKLQLIRYPQTEATARGAVWLCLEKSKNTFAVEPYDRMFYPNSDPALESRYAEFKQALQSSHNRSTI